jgi:hypothetical protein
MAPLQDDDIPERAPPPKARLRPLKYLIDALVILALASQGLSLRLPIWWIGSQGLPT